MKHGDVRFISGSAAQTCINRSWLIWGRAFKRSRRLGHTRENYQGSIAFIVLQLITVVAIMVLPCLVLGDMAKDKGWGLSLKLRNV